MSLFDVIKYPISDPPIKDELLALPDELFSVWINQSDGWARITEDANLVTYKIEVSNYYNNYLKQAFYDGDRDLADITLLRKIIKEWS